MIPLVCLCGRVALACTDTYYLGWFWYHINYALRIQRESHGNSMIIIWNILIRRPQITKGLDCNASSRQSTFFCFSLWFFYFAHRKVELSFACKKVYMYSHILKFLSFAIIHFTILMQLHFIKEGIRVQWVCTIVRELEKQLRKRKTAWYASYVLIFTCLTGYEWLHKPILKTYAFSCLKLCFHQGIWAFAKVMWITGIFSCVLMQVRSCNLNQIVFNTRKQNSI